MSVWVNAIMNECIMFFGTFFFLNYIEI